jgi:hypothetical protein
MGERLVPPRWNLSKQSRGAWHANARGCGRSTVLDQPCTPTLFMEYTFEELQLIAEALTYLEYRSLLTGTKIKRIAKLADKVAKDQSSKAEA